MNGNVTSGVWRLASGVWRLASGNIKTQKTIVYLINDGFL